jgi:hypothetical protein
MAMTRLAPASGAPVLLPGQMLGDEQPSFHERWERAGVLSSWERGGAGLRDLRSYAADELPGHVGVRDLRARGRMPLIWTTIEGAPEPAAHLGARAAYTTEPFSEPDESRGIGPVECVNVEHEGGR